MTRARRLGRKSLSLLVRHLDKSYSRAELTDLLFRNGLGPLGSGSKLANLSAIFNPLVEADTGEDEIRKSIELLEQEITVPAFEAMQPNECGDQSETAQQLYESFQNALRADGLDLVEGRVVPFLSPAVDPAREQGILESRLDEYGFTVARNLLNQAVDNAAHGNWEAANSQTRSFLEALCGEVAGKPCVGGESPTRGDARKHLEETGFLNQQESKLLSALFVVLSGEGAHPGTSSEDDCHRRRLMAFAMANYYLERLDGWDRGQ